MVNEYAVTDIGLASTLKLIFPKMFLQARRKNPGQVEFVFKRDNELLDSVQKFFTDDLKVSPREFIDQRNRLLDLLRTV